MANSTALMTPAVNSVELLLSPSHHHQKKEGGMQVGATVGRGTRQSESHLHK